MIDHFKLAFDPILPWTALAVLAALAIGLSVFAVMRGQRGQILRLIFFALLLTALARPQWVVEKSDPLKDVAAIVVDRSQSQGIGQRREQTDKALAAVKSALDAQPGLETRVIEAGSSGEDGTALFGPLTRALADLPNDRLAGVVMITDGQVHDVPTDPHQAGLNAPIHVLLTGRKGETDRRLIVEEAPRFAILNEPNEIAVRVEDDAVPKGTRLPLSLAIDGAAAVTQAVTVGETTHIPIQLGHAGPNIVEMEVPPGDSYLTLANKRAVVTIKGIRNRLRVLLVSGEPYPGERTWRNLLKADPAVDLVHFTILRPPEKQDGTPFNQLALIAFPTRELFVDKLSQFDLIIFDRHHWRGILPAAYFDNIARYVENGGSLLAAVGAAYAQPNSLFRTPLAAILPSEPTGQVIDQQFRPALTDLGRRHPVTADLPGSGTPGSDPKWGHWFRLIETRPLMGQTVMEGPGGRPLLQLARVGQGRVAELLSDEVWLWARGYDGGGPHAELLRRIAHWLMKEPDLEEETLRGEARGGHIEIDRRSLADRVAPVAVTDPSGKTVSVDLTAGDSGHWRAEIDAPEQGLYHLTDGQLSALVVVGPANSREMQDVRATADKLAPVTAATNGGTFWLSENGVPEFRRVDPGHVTHGATWAGLLANGRANVTSVTSAPLLPASLLLLLSLGGLLLAWWREGR